MKRTLLTVVAVTAVAAGVFAQTFNPSASALPGATINQAYSGQVINFTVPATADFNTSALGDPITIPGVPIPVPNPNIEVAADVTDVTWSVEGLPSGMTATCDATPCTYVANASGTITLAGTPTEAGTFTINITSSTNGSATLPAPISQTIAFPQAVPGMLDENGYTLVVDDPNGIEEANTSFSLSIYPNPTESNAVLDLTSRITGMATIEVFSITGALIQTETDAVAVGSNRIDLDLSSVPTGIYLVKADINGGQALVRIQKK